MRAPFDRLVSVATGLLRSAIRGAAALLAATLLVVAGTSEVHAEDVRMPRIGQQFFTLGLNLQPGFVYDRTAPDDPEWGVVAPTGAGMFRAGFHQIVSESFLMSADVDIGLQWLNEHTAETTGRAASELAFAWQLALVGRWVPGDDQSGWTVGGGPHLYQAYLADRPLQSLGLDLKAGRYIWRGNENFVLVELGYALPFIQGLNRDNDFGDENPDAVPKNWTFHRFSISLQYGF